MPDQNPNPLDPFASAFNPINPGSPPSGSTAEPAHHNKRDVLRNMHNAQAAAATPGSAPWWDVNQASESATDDRNVDQQPAPPPPWGAAPPTEPTREAPPSSFDIEKLIAGKWFAVLGSLCVVISAGLFLKLAADRGWLSAISPAVRCIGVGSIGLAMIALGELIRRKVNSLAASGVSAAGVATTYCSVLAAWGLFKLLDPNAAFIMLAAVVALGILSSG